jgi:hypothetical protein
MKSDTQPVLDQATAPHKWRAINPWLLVFGLVFSIVIVIAAMCFVLAWMPPEQTLGDNERLLPDGSILKIEAVQVGSNQQIVVPYWPRNGWPTFEPAPVELNAGNNEGLSIWMSRRDRRSGRSLDFDWWASSLAVNS